jgi:hypothetical protein
MRGAFIHVFTGLLLGVALAGLLHAPAEVVAHQEARTPVTRPKAADASVTERTVRISPRVERALEERRARLARRKPVRPATVPASRPVLARALPSLPTVEPPPAVFPAPAEPAPAPPPPPPPSPPPAKNVASNPQPPPPPAAEDDDEEDEDDDDDGGGDDGGDDDDDGGDDEDD